MNGKDILFMRSTKKKTKSGSDSISMIEDDVWDDSVLVEAYNKAVDQAHEKIAKNLPGFPPMQEIDAPESGQKIQWKVGDHCRCEFIEDYIFYEAEIIDIIPELDMCVVKYVGYENEAQLALSKLKPSSGGMARSVQKKDAAMENGVIGGLAGMSGRRLRGLRNLPRSEENITQIPDIMQGNDPFPADEINNHYPTSPQMFKPPLMGAIPPPPPPQMFTKMDDNVPETDAMNAMLMSWYMSGYHTGYYQGLKAAKK